MAFNLISSYSGWFLILPVPAFAFYYLGYVAGVLVGEDWDKKVIEYPSCFHILGKQVSHFFSENAHIFSHLPFIIDVFIEALLFAIDVPDQVQLYLAVPQGQLIITIAAVLFCIYVTVAYISVLVIFKKQNSQNLPQFSKKL